MAANGTVATNWNICSILMFRVPSQRFLSNFTFNLASVILNMNTYCSIVP